MAASIPKGTRDFGPVEMARRNYIFSTIRSVFELYGYQPIETPAMENLSTLLGKYGDEGDKLLFRILNSGDFISDLNDNFNEVHLKSLDKFWENEIISNISNSKRPFKDFKDLINSYKDSNDQIKRIFYTYFENCIDVIKEYIDENKIKKPLDFIKYLNHYRRPQTKQKLNKLKEDSAEVVKGISEKGLRYDLTVPFARYVVQHQNEITFPFKRYQIQPVWRADRPQKGRYREFYQCDADVVGSDSLLNEVEMVQILTDVFTKLGIRVVIKMNNRKILSGIAELIGQPDKIVDITVAIDKLDKIGIEKVKEELVARGLNADAIAKLQPILEMKGTNTEKLTTLKNTLVKSEIGLRGIDEIEDVIKQYSILNIQSLIEFDLTLARGLNYYTGAIFEVKALDVPIGSISGGGRYDNLTGVFGMPGVSGVGISFGADRIYDVLNQLNAFPETAGVSTKVLVANFGTATLNASIKLVKTLRSSGISAELYPDEAKMKKQFGYADVRKIPYVAILGEDEVKENQVSVKDMSTGEQTKMAIDQLLEHILGVKQ